MRKILLVLLMAMLPLQWSAAAMAALCLPSAQAAVFTHAHTGVRADEVDHAHDHTLGSANDQASHHHPGTHDQGHDSKALHADHGGCCHATGSAALPTQLAVAGMQAPPGDLVDHMTVLAVSHASESPFRPPRLALA